MKRLFNLRDALVFAALWLGFMLAGRTALLQDPGTFWHTAAGERMCTSGRVLREDPFGVATHGKPWIPMQWLAEIGMALLYRVGRIDALVAASAAILALIYAGLARHLTRRGCRPPLVAALLMVALAASSHHFIARPHLFTILFVGWTYACLLRWEEGGRARAWRLLTLPPCFVLWTNLHGGVAGGVAMVALAAAGWAFAPFVGIRPLCASRRDALIVLGVTAGCVGAIFVNPFGAALARTWVTLASSGVLPKLIKEHAAPTFTSPGDLAVALLGLLYVAVLAGVPWRSQRVTFVVPLLWLAMSLRSVRHAPLVALLALLALPALLRECAWIRRRFEARPDSPFALRDAAPPPEAWGGLVAAPIVVLALALCLQARRAQVPVFGAGWAAPDESVAPLDLLPALDDAARRAPDGSGILNEISHGGFVILFVPRLRVFIDDRWEVHGDETLLRYAHASDHEPAALDAWAKELQIGLALAPLGSPLEVYLAASPAWERRAQGASASLFQRR